MSTHWSRRKFLKGVAAVGTVASPLSLAMAQDKPKQGAEKEREIPKENFVEPNGLTGDPLDLPDWSYGETSSSTETMLMFRGNPSHTFYGTGTVSEKPTLQWSQPLAMFHSVLRGRKVIWTGTGWSGQPTLLGDYVFVGGQGGYLYAFDKMTGEIRWRHQAERMYKSSSCIYKNRIYIGNTDDYFRCVDLKTGELVWKIDTGTDCDSSGVVVDDKLYVAGESGYLRCLDPATGKHHWKSMLGGIGKGTLPGSNGSETSPAVADGEVFAATYDGILHCVDAKTGKTNWTAETGDDTDASAVIVDGLVYIAAEEKAPRLYCFDREKKGETVWSFKNENGWWSTPAVVGDRLYIGGNDARVYCLDAKSGKEIWTYKAPAAVWSSPAVVDGKVIFGCRDPYLYMLDAKSGKFIWKGEMGGRTLSTPIVVDGRIYVGTSNGDFRCFA